MVRLCERPGCSEPGAAAYGMIPEDLMFWISTLRDAPTADPNVLCRRHADAMVVPRGWTLDDRRENTLRLFASRPSGEAARRAVARRRRTPSDADQRPEQLQLDGTGEIPRPDVGDGDPSESVPGPDGPDAPGDPGEPDAAGERWQPRFDAADDLGGLLEVSSPLLARAFRGTGRSRR